jgi:prepilin-type N-terminal cleavage/methylation domain-containing protein
MIFNMKKNSPIYSGQRGLSLVELIIVLAIAGILLGISAAAFVNLSNTDLILAASQEVVSGLRQAQSQARSGLGDSAYGIHFTSSSATLFAGTTYQDGAGGNAVLPLPANISISASPSDFVFQKISGTTTSGTIQVYLSSHSSYEKTISVQSTGVAEIQ